jgi:hypothetical protein
MFSLSSCVEFLLWGLYILKSSQLLSSSHIIIIIIIIIILLIRLPSGLPDCEGSTDWVKVLATKEYWLFLGYWFLGNVGKFLPDHTTLSKKWQYFIAIAFGTPQVARTYFIPGRSFIPTLHGEVYKLFLVHNIYIYIYNLTNVLNLILTIIHIYHMHTYIYIILHYTSITPSSERKNSIISSWWWHRAEICRRKHM